MLYGRLCESDCKAKSKVAVIDEVLAEKVLAERTLLAKALRLIYGEEILNLRLLE